MRCPTTLGLIVLLAIPLSHAQQPTRTAFVARSSLSQAGTFTARSTTTATRPLSTAPEWAALASRTGDSTRTALTRQDRRVLGGLHLTIGAIGLGGGTLTGIGAYKLLSSSGDSEWSSLGTSLGIVLLAGAVSLTGTGIYMTIQGIRILQGKAPSAIPIPRSAAPPLLRDHSPLSLTIPL
jgi:hypothetical protein